MSQSLSSATAASVRTSKTTTFQRFDYLERLPTELLANLLQLAGPRACVRVACASRRLWQIGAAHPALWRNLYVNSFPLDDKEIEWIEWCSGIIALEEEKEISAYDNDTSDTLSVDLPTADIQSGTASPIYARTTNVVSSPPPVLRGPLVRWFWLFRRRVYTDRNWRQVSFELNTLQFPGAFSKAAWRELHIWKSSLSNTIFFLDAHVYNGHTTANRAIDTANDDIDSSHNDISNINASTHTDIDYYDNLSFNDNDNEYYDDFYDSCDSDEDENEHDYRLESGEDLLLSNADSTNTVIGGQLFILRHQPGATVQELNLGPEYLRLSLRRAPIVRSNSQYIVVDGDAVLKNSELITTKNDSINEVNGNEFTCLSTAPKSPINRPTIQRRVWIWRVVNELIDGPSSSAHIELMFADLMSNWLLCRRTKGVANELKTDHILYDLSQYTGKSASTADEHIIASLAEDATAVHFQRISRNAAAIDKYGQVNRTGTRKTGDSTTGIFVYSHNYISDNTATSKANSQVDSKDNVSQQFKSLAWRVDAIYHTEKNTTVKCVASGICKDLLTNEITQSQPLLASRIDDDRVLFQVHMAGCTFVRDGGNILWQQHGNFYRLELYTGYGFVAVNSTIDEEEAIDTPSTSATSLAMPIHAISSSSSPSSSSNYVKSNTTYMVSDLAGPFENCCDDAVCRRLTYGKLINPSSTTAHAPMNDEVPEMASVSSRTVVLSPDNGNSIDDGKKHVAEHGDLSDINQEQRQSFIQLLCLAHGRPLRQPMRFNGLCRATRIIGSIGLTTPASAAEWYFCVTDIATGLPLSRLDFVQRGRNPKGQICSTYSVMVDEDRPGYCWVFNFSESSSKPISNNNLPI
ncbi:hypothetical protein BDF19DRAFT_436475 [Syncephalis fuscata]|nr:hypothetical protein BDF19DRAFT_436475 [Syncephalis fuscata]